MDIEFASTVELEPEESCVVFNNDGTMTVYANTKDDGGTAPQSLVVAMAIMDRAAGDDGWLDEAVEKLQDRIEASEGANPVPQKPDDGRITWPGD